MVAEWWRRRKVSAHRIASLSGSGSEHYARYLARKQKKKKKKRGGGAARTSHDPHTILNLDSCSNITSYFCIFLFNPNTSPLSEQQSDCHRARSGGKSWSAAGKCCCAAVLFIGAGLWVGFLLGFKALHCLLRVSNIPPTAQNNNYDLIALFWVTNPTCLLALRITINTII